MTTTFEQVNGAVQVVQAVADAIYKLGRIPSGHLYAVLQVSGCTLAQYEEIIGALQDAGLITVQSHELVWVGPTA